MDGQRLLVHLRRSVEFITLTVNESKIAVLNGEAFEQPELLMDGQRFLVHLLRSIEFTTLPINESKIAC